MTDQHKELSIHPDATSMLYATLPHFDHFSLFLCELMVERWSELLAVREEEQLWVLCLEFELSHPIH